MNDRRLMVLIAVALVAAGTAAGALYLGFSSSGGAAGPASGTRPAEGTSPIGPAVAGLAAAYKAPGAPPRKHPIGQAVERNGLRIAAVWRPGLPATGQAAPDPSALHLEARVHADEGSPHGFAAGEWVPYLSIRYTIEPAEGGDPLAGELRPIVDADGPHYGANLILPGPGTYRLTLRLEPPGADALARSVDAIMGVAPWWSPFEIPLEWTYR